MIVIGADTHKRSHTCAAARAGTGEAAGHKTAVARKPGFRELLDWGRSLDAERIWAIEDCRHVSGNFERFLIEHGERVVRVPPKLMGESRRAERARGNSDPIDALAIARAALKEGPENLPAAHLDESALELKLLLDHREDLVRSRVEDQQRLRWHLHDLWPELELPAGCLDRTVWLERIGRKLSRVEQTARVRVSRELLRAIRERTRRIRRSSSRSLSSSQIGAGAAGAARLRPADRRQARRRDRGCRTLPLRREAGAACRRRPDPGLLGQPPAPPARPRRQPPAQLRPAPDRGHPGPLARARVRVPRPEASGGQVAKGGASLPQAPPRSDRLAGPSRGSRPRVDQLPLPY